MGKWTTYLMKVYLGKLCVSSILIQCKSAIHVIYHTQKPARDHLLRLIVLLMLNICNTLRKYDLFDYFTLWFEVSVFPVCSWWKATVRRELRENQNEVWSDFCLKHPDLKQAYEYLNNVPLDHFWSLANHYADLVS